MPRARPPSNVQHPAADFTGLDAATQRKLVCDLSIQNKEVEQIALSQINDIVLRYFQRSALAKGITPKRLLAAIGPTNSAARLLSRRLSALDKRSMVLLYGCGWTDSDAAAVYRVAAVLELTESKLKGITTSRENWPLKLVVVELFFAFNHFKQNNGRANWDSFLSIVLDAAKIDHPHPNIHPQRFKNLLPEALRSSPKPHR